MRYQKIFNLKNEQQRVDCPPACDFLPWLVNQAKEEAFRKFPAEWRTANTELGDENQSFLVELVTDKIK